MEKVLHTRSESETEAFGEKIAEAVIPGMVIALSGELGAGKTALVRGICRGLKASRDSARSPTFAILNIYPSGRIPVYHFDMYRISGSVEAFETGMEDYLEGDGLSVVEWAERIAPEMPSRTFWVKISHEGDDLREIRFPQELEIPRRK